MLKAVIVEDEEASRITLENYLAEYCPDVQLMDFADSVKTGVEVIQKHRPDLVFLDVEMPYGNAFDLLEQVGELEFETIFVTAFSTYAMRALNLSASYYLLKPIDIDELIKAVDIIKKEKDKKEYSIHNKVLIENIRATNMQLHKIVLPMIDGFEVVHVKDILRCKANDNLTEFYMIDGSKYMICRTLKFFEDLLNEMDFVRVHKSHLINIQHMKKYKKGKGGQAIMVDGSVVDVSVNRKKELLAKF